MSLTSLVACTPINVCEQHGITEIQTHVIKWGSLQKYCPKDHGDYFGGEDVNGGFPPSS